MPVRRACYPLYLLPLTKRAVGTGDVTEKNTLVLWRTNESPDASLVAVDKLLTDLGLVSGGTVWGFDRVQESHGIRKLKPKQGGARYVVDAVALADLDQSNMGQLLEPGMENFQFVFEYYRSGSDLQPVNGGNCTAWVSRKKFHIACGRLVKVR